MAPRFLLCSFLLIVVCNVHAMPAGQQSSSENVWEMRDTLTVSESTRTPSKDTDVENRLLVKTGKKKYYLETIFKVNWYKAMEYCLYHGMQLASIESKEENDAVLNCIVNSGYEKDHFWTSGTDLGEEGKFIWMSNGRRLIFNDWGPSEPNNIVRGGEGENCLEIADNGSGRKWNDNPCSYQSYFICQDIMD